VHVVTGYSLASLLSSTDNEHPNIGPSWAKGWPAITFWQAILSLEISNRRVFGAIEG
jgi:hypothetical protein